MMDREWWMVDIDKQLADLRCVQSISISKQLGGFARFLRSKKRMVKDE
jgi:hypothetical protein